MLFQKLVVGAVRGSELLLFRRSDSRLRFAYKRSRKLKWMVSVAASRMVAGAVEGGAGCFVVFSIVTGVRLDRGGEGGRFSRSFASSTLVAGA